MKNFLLKIQSLPESNRKTIFWVATVILAVTLLSFYVRTVQKRLEGIEARTLKEELLVPLSPLEEEFRRLPEIELPELKILETNQEKLQKRLEELKQIIEEEPI